MTKRNELFRLGISLLDEFCPETEAMLYHHVYSLQFGDNFVIQDMADLIEIVLVINDWNKERKQLLLFLPVVKGRDKTQKIFVEG